jgi:hypothetical protein
MDADLRWFAWHFGQLPCELGAKLEIVPSGETATLRSLVFVD